MPTLNHAAFIARLKGRSIDAVALRDAHPDLSISGIAGDGIIEGTTQNLERLWEAIDRYDHDGNVNTISDSTRVIDCRVAVHQYGKSGISE